MGRQYTQQHVAGRASYAMRHGIGALIMVGLMVAGFVVLCICVGSDLWGAMQS